MARTPDFMLRLREALAASWDKRTAYLEVEQVENPALGQCYPTARVVQHYYPETEIIKGKVWTGKTLEVHFWNGLRLGDDCYHIDLSWQQFPAGSIIQEFVIVEHEEMNDSEATLERCALLLKRVDDRLNARSRILRKDMLAITQLTDLHPQLLDLEREASKFGFNFLGRLIDEWRTGTNRFDKPGERILFAAENGTIVAIGGLNVDPYKSTGDSARLRRLYVANDFRRRGIGEALVCALLDGASARFRVVRLSTDTEAAAAFYTRLGFSAVDDGTATHIKVL